MKKRQRCKDDSRFLICDRRGHMPIAAFPSWNETIRIMKKFVKDDRKEELYRPHFYEAVEFSPERGIVRSKISD